MKENNTEILIVDDEEHICVILSRLLEGEGFKPLVAHDGDTALKMIRSDTPQVLLLDYRMPDMNGMEVLRRARGLDPELPVIMITAHADVNGAVEAMKAGVHDYLAKPFEHHEVIRVVHRALAERDLKQKLKHLSSQVSDSVSLSKMMGPSNAIGRIIADVNSVANSDLTVVIMGETGSGKELVARAIHNVSPRSRYAFIPVDCGAIPETLLESELFGHEKGAFTGAVLRKAGKFEMAKAGTLLLDEVSNMPLGSQAKLLRVLQEKKIYRVGGNEALDIDVRLLVASNQDLAAALQAGSFRRDLFYRLNEFVINVPPLRKRQEDIPYLAKRFLDATNIELGKRVEGFSESAIEALLAYDWPGNVRQLRSTIRRAVVLAHDVITEKHLDMKRVPAPSLTFAPQIQGMPWGDLSLKQIVRSNTMAIEREVIVQALKYTGGNKAKAARLLKIDYKTIHTKVKTLGISTDII
jgi:two-component system nitrogen regulation response regulator GlnG